MAGLRAAVPQRRAAACASLVWWQATGMQPPAQTAHPQQVLSVKVQSHRTAQGWARSVARCTCQKVHAAQLTVALQSSRQRLQSPPAA